VLVEREQPARRDPLIDDAIEAHGGPAMADVADRGEAVGERRDPVCFAPPGDADVSATACDAPLLIRGCRPWQPQVPP
jgi:hypothetical protein